MEGTSTRCQPAGLSNRRIDRPSQTRLSVAQPDIELVAIRVAEDEDVDVSNRARPITSLVPGGPGSVDVGVGDSLDLAQDFGEDGGDAERPGEHLCQAGIVGAVGVRAGKPGVPYLAGRDQSGLFCPLDLAVDRRMWRTGALRDLSQAKLQVRIAKEQREYLPLLLRAQHGQERRRRLSVH